MPNNRDYTGLVKTPSSMAWLIRERRRLRGLIDRLKGDLVELPQKIATFEARLASLDDVFPLHEVKVEPQKIEGVRQHKPALVAYGAMTRGILSSLREATTPLYTSEIAMQVARHAGLDMKTVRKSTLNYAVHRRLIKLRHEGFIEAVHDPVAGTNTEGQWRINQAYLERMAA